MNLFVNIHDIVVFAKQKLLTEHWMLDMLVFVSGEQQQLAKQGGWQRGGRGPSRKVKWGQGWNNDKHTGGSAGFSVVKCH